MSGWLAKFWQTARARGDNSPAVNHHGTGDVTITYNLADPAAATRHDETQAKLDTLLAIAQAGGAFTRAAAQGISETAVRAIVERLGGLSVEPDDLLPWLDNWIENARTELARHGNEGAAYEAAWREAERRFNAGRLDQASEAFMDELRRDDVREAERQRERHHHRIALLEAAIDFDTRALNITAIPVKLRLIAGEEGIAPGDALGSWLHARADDRYEYGQDKGDNTALLVAIEIWRAALEERTRDRLPPDWATTQNNLGNALTTLGERTTGTPHLEQAVAAYDACLAVAATAWPPEWIETVQKNCNQAQAEINRRRAGPSR